MRRLALASSFCLAACAEPTAVGPRIGPPPAVELVSISSNPTSVTLVGSFQSELGCSGDWDPACANTGLVYEATDDVWQRTFTLPAGSWEYKAALNGGWAENYGSAATPNGPNIPLTLGGATAVKFYYSATTHWITDNRRSVIATAAGSFQSELGCPVDWDPGCLRSWLQDPDENGTLTFETQAIPAGAYEWKVAINEGWTENYGANGVPAGANIPFTVPAGGATVTFTFDAGTKVPNVTVTPLVSVSDGVAALRADVEAVELFPVKLRRSLTAKLDAALAAIAADDTAAACQALADFSSQVRAQRGKAIPVETADAWLAQAAALRASLGC